MLNIYPVTEFRQKTTAMIKEVNETGNPLYLTQNGRAAAVVVSPYEWEKMQQTLAMLQVLAISEREVEAGNVCDFDVVMDEINKMIADYGKE